MKKSSFSELIAFALLFGLGLFTMARGVFWVKEQESVLNDSEFYTALHEIMPIWMWGIFAIIVSLFMVIGAFFIPKQKMNNLCDYFLFIGGFGMFILYFLMTSASIYNALNWLSIVQFPILAVVCAVVGFIGGADIYDRRK